MKLFVQLLLLFIFSTAFGQKLVYEELDRDESRFVARITDRSDSGRVMKIKSENRNVKFFQKGDLINFNLYNQKNVRACSAQIEDVEESFIVVRPVSYTHLTLPTILLV